MLDDSSHDDFDWVAAQAACTAETMFPRLLAGVRRDVERRNALTNRADQFHFQVDEDEDEDRFDVIRTIGEPTDTTHVHASVTFERIGSRINVQGDHVDVDVTAVVGINPSGTCRFFVAEAEYAEWEMRKLALDQLFFEEIEE
jgi:hypothetical protein